MIPCSTLFSTKAAGKRGFVFFIFTRIKNRDDFQFLEIPVKITKNHIFSIINFQPCYYYHN